MVTARIAMQYSREASGERHRFNASESKTINPRIHLPQGWDVALDRRNYLFHRFFYEKAFSLYTKAGCELLVKELEEMTTMFEKAGWSARALVDQLVENLGISPEAS